MPDQVMEDVSSKCKVHAGTNRPTGKLLKKAKDYIEIVGPSTTRSPH